MGCVVPVEDRCDVHQMLVASIVSNAVCREQGSVVLEHHCSCLALCYVLDIDIIKLNIH